MNVTSRSGGGNQRFLGGITGIIDGSGRVVGHVGYVDDAAMQCRRGRGGEGLLVRFLAGYVFASMDVNVAHTGEDQAAFRKDMRCRATLRTNRDDGPVLDANLTVPNTIDIR